MVEQLKDWMIQHRTTLSAGLALLLAIATGLAAHYLVEEYHQGSLIVPTVAVVFTLALILSITINAGFLRQLIKLVEQLDRRNRLRIDFVSAGRSDEPDVVHIQARAFLDHADKDSEIFGVNSYLEATSGEPHETAAVGEYYATLATLAASGARYTRIVQLPKDMAAAPYEQWTKATKEHYMTHFDNVLEMRDDKDVKSAELIQVRFRFPLSFLLIQNANGTNYLIWQVDEQTKEAMQGKPNFKLHGIFLLEDPDKNIVDHFVWCVNQLRNAGKPAKRAIRES